MKLLVLFTALLAGYNSYGQLQEYTFLYKYSEINGSGPVFPSPDTAILRTIVTSRLVDNAYISGVINSNGTYLTLFIDETSVNTAGAFDPIKIDAKTRSEQPHIFYRDNYFAKVENRDTTCFFIDSSIVLVPTGRKKMINKWNCIEYVAANNNYRHLSIWASNSIPASIKPGPITGINGIVAIVNKDKQITLQLLGYKKAKNTHFTPISCRRAPITKFAGLDIYE